MKMDCDVIRDLLPLYTDEACSGKSRVLVEEHLQECPSCRDLLRTLKDTEIENDLHSEKESVLRYGEKQFKRRSATVGSVVSSVFMIPILVCLTINIAMGQAMGWVFIVLAALAVAASLILVPIIMPEDKLFWTFCAFCASLQLLLGVTCLYSHGNWFGIASSATLFGLAVIFLPFVVKARPVRKLIGDSNRLLIVLGTDAVLFINMMKIILSHGRITFRSIIFTLGIIAGIALVLFEIIRKRRTEK